MNIQCPPGFSQCPSSNEPDTMMCCEQERKSSNRKVSFSRVNSVGNLEKIKQSTTPLRITKKIGSTNEAVPLESREGACWIFYQGEYFYGFAGDADGNGCPEGQVPTYSHMGYMGRSGETLDGGVSVCFCLSMMPEASGDPSDSRAR